MRLAPRLPRRPHVALFRQCLREVCAHFAEAELRSCGLVVNPQAPAVDAHFARDYTEGADCAESNKGRITDFVRAFAFDEPTYS